MRGKSRVARVASHAGIDPPMSDSTWQVTRVFPGPACTSL